MGQVIILCVTCLQWLKRTYLNCLVKSFDLISLIGLVSLMSTQIQWFTVLESNFLRQADHNQQLLDVNDAQLDRYYKEFLFDTGDTEKAFLASISRLAKYPVVGGLSFHWKENSMFVESSLILHDETLGTAFTDAINNTVMLAQGIEQKGFFKCCLFDARKTIQLERDGTGAFKFEHLPELDYEVMDLQASDITRPHSYFEDGKDPDEQLQLPEKGHKMRI